MVARWLPQFRTSQLLTTVFKTSRKEGWGKALISENKMFPSPPLGFYPTSYWLNLSHMAILCYKGHWELDFSPSIFGAGKEKREQLMAVGSQETSFATPATDSNL